MFWAPVKSPIYDGGTVIGVLHRVRDVTQLEEDLPNVLTNDRRVAEPEQVTPEESRGFTHCSADEPYKLLVHMSNQTNVRLADVAAAPVN